MSQKRYYYVTGNTAEGTKNYVQSNIEQLDRVIILNHESQILKTAVLRKLIDTYEADHDLEILKSPLGARYLDGVIIREKSAAFIIDDIANPELENAVTINLNVPFPKTPSIDQAKAKIDTLTKAAHDNFETGLNVHDDLESVYVKEMNFARANQLTEELIEELLQNVPAKDRQANVYRRMFGTNTADGVVNEVPHLTNAMKHVYYIKGRAGTGKSTLMKKVANACQQKGLDVEVYYCSFDPSSLDMVIVRDLDFCIFDSTDPHEFFPSRTGEVILDLYEETVTPGTDEKYAVQIQQINQHYKSFMKKGIENLMEAGKYLEEIESQYAFTEKDVEQIVESLQGK